MVNSGFKALNIKYVKSIALQMPHPPIMLSPVISIFWSPQKEKLTSILMFDGSAVLQRTQQRRMDDDEQQFNVTSFLLLEGSLLSSLP